MAWMAPFVPELLLSPFRGLMPWMLQALPDAVRTAGGIGAGLLLALYQLLLLRFRLSFIHNRRAL